MHDLPPEQAHPRVKLQVEVEVPGGVPLVAAPGRHDAPGAAGLLSIRGHSSRAGEQADNLRNILKLEKVRQRFLKSDLRSARARDLISVCPHLGPGPALSFHHRRRHCVKCVNAGTY